MKNLKKMFATALLGISLAIPSLSGYCADQKEVDQVIKKVLESKNVMTGPLGTINYLEKIEEITENKERRVYISVNSPGLCVAIVVQEKFKVQGNLKAQEPYATPHGQRVKEGYLIEEKIIIDGGFTYGLPDGKVDLLVERKVLQTLDGYFLSHDEGEKSLSDARLREETQKVYDSSIEHFLKSK